MRLALLLPFLLAPALAHAGPLQAWTPPPVEPEIRADLDAAKAAGLFRPMPFDNAAPVELVLAVLADNGFAAAPHAVASWYDMGGVVPGELVMVVQLRGQEHEIPGLNGQRLLGFFYDDARPGWRLVLDTAAMAYGVKQGHIVAIHETGLSPFRWNGEQFSPDDSQ